MVTVLDVALIAGAAGCATGLGAFPTLLTDKISHRVYDAAVGLAAGIMFGAAVFALVLPGLELGSLGEVGGGILFGGLFLLAANALLPHLHLEFAGEHSEGPRVDGEDGLRRAMLVGAAITIHNVPEGLAVGIAFASGEEALGLALAFAIAVQNVPDGFAMAVPAVSAGVSRPKTALYTTLSGGIPEPVAAVCGFALVSVITDVFPVAAGFAAGAMIAVIFREMIPASHGHGYEDFATLTFVVGFIVMMVVDVALAV
ncbi:ZIP family metal transporter [Halobacteriales archaeon SW_7_65_23]|nr:MAG: ZIP family metal transporter [Halobacteriales archaeon SW_7_65_23]